MINLLTQVRQFECVSGVYDIDERLQFEPSSSHVLVVVEQGEFEGGLYLVCSLFKYGSCNHIMRRKNVNFLIHVRR